MTAVLQNHRGHGPAVVAERMRSLAMEIVRTIQRRWRIESIVAQLEARTDRELADMGFCRSDIRHIARQSAAGV